MRAKAGRGRVVVRWAVGWLLSLTLLGASAWDDRGQSQEAFTPDQQAAHVEQLRNIREGIMDVNARPADRRRWATVLLSYDTTAARALAIDLLRLSDRPEVQQALCDVVAETARGNPGRVDSSFVDPLLGLLGAEAGELRELAAAALAELPAAEVPARLGELAARSDAPLVKRLAAIGALASNTHRRDVVGQLIALLDCGAPQVVERTTAALAGAVPESFGSDEARWRRWWEEQSQLGEESWLAGQLRMYRDRARQLADELRVLRERAKTEEAALTARARGLQRELYRALPTDQRDAKLVEWLGDPVPVVKLTALSIVRARIADEGKRPEEAVLASLLVQLRQGSPAVRQDVLDVVQNLTDQTVVEAVLAQLPREDDPRVRLAIFKALGKLDSRAAIPALVAEVASPNSPADCVREAAIALGTVAAQTTAAEDLDSAVAALKSRYQDSGDADPAMRAALLTAMAGVAHDAFAPEFLGAVESDDAAILEPAIRGVLALDGRSKLLRLRTLMGHADPRVRLAAIEAVGQLGREEADIESLLTRLNPSIEANELACEAAWRGFGQVLAHRSMADRIAAADRLRDFPALQIRYLEELVDVLSSTDGDTAPLETVLDRLAAILVSVGRYAEASAHLQTLYGFQTARADAGALGCGLRLLHAKLRGPDDPGVAELIGRLRAIAADEAARATIADAVGRYLESLDAGANPERMRRLLVELNSVPADAMGPSWTPMLEGAARRFPATESQSVPPSIPPGN